MTPQGPKAENFTTSRAFGYGLHSGRRRHHTWRAYDFLTGGTSLNFHLLTWIDSSDPTAGGNNGTCLVAKSMPCWGANIVTISASLFDGQSNQSAITAGANGMSNAALEINQFAEFGINLTQALGLAGKCFAFPQEVWESRSSRSSFTSNPQDIEIEHTTIANCGEIKIIKQTDPRGTNQNFSFTSSMASPGASNPPTPKCTQSPANPSSFTLNDNAGGRQDGGPRRVRALVDASEPGPGGSRRARVLGDTGLMKRSRSSASFISSTLTTARRWNRGAKSG